MHLEHPKASDSSKNIKLAFFLNLGFAIIEVIGGFYTNSISIISDALHDFGDSLSLGLAWYFANLSKKKRDENFSFGYKRFSLLGALITSFVLFVGSVFIIIEAIPRLLNPQAVNVPGMFVLALLGIVVNGVSYWKTHKSHNINEKVVSLHLLEDLLGWLAVLIASTIMYFVDLPILDPLLSVGITLFILWNVFKNIGKTINIFLQGSPSNINKSKIEEELASKLAIKSIHDIHVWSLDGEYNVLSLHVVVGNTAKKEQIIEIKNLCRKILKEQGIQHSTIEIEYESESCELEKC